MLELCEKNNKYPFKLHKVTDAIKKATHEDDKRN